MTARAALAVRLDRESTRLRYLADRFTTYSAEDGTPTRAELDRLAGVIRALDTMVQDLHSESAPAPLESPRTPTPVPDPSETPERAREAARLRGNDRPACPPRCGRGFCYCAARDPWGRMARGAR